MFNLLTNCSTCFKPKMTPTEALAVLSVATLGFEASWESNRSKSSNLGSKLRREKSICNEVATSTTSHSLHSEMGEWQS